MTGCGKALLLLSRDIRVEYYFIIKGFKKSFKKKKIDFENLQGFLPGNTIGFSIIHQNTGNKPA